MSFQFLVIAGPDKDKVFTLQPGADLVLGRGNEAAYKLTDPRSSRAHCQVLFDEGAVSIVCKGGSGGTMVNGKKIQQQTLKPGDVLQVGDSQLRLRVGDGAAKPGATGETATIPPGKNAPPPQPELLETLSGTTLGHYEIGPIIGKGRMGIVFHANDTKDNRSVALKVLLPEFSRNEEDMQRFVRAMKTMLPLRHPNLVAIFAAGKTGAHCWVAMEYIAGENMTQVINRIGVAGMLDWRYGFKVAVHVARALAYAHGQQIVHRNVTPTNILLQATDKVVKLGDLMLAKALEGAMAQQVTRPGQMVGDIVYMAPERTRGEEHADARSDLYGVGATVYALLTGRPPFQGATLVEQVAKIRNEQPAKPSKYQLSIPHPFELVVVKLLEKDPALRYQAAEELLADLDKVGKTKGVSV